jgi:glycerol kinase
MFGLSPTNKGASAASAAIQAVDTVKVYIDVLLASVSNDSNNYNNDGDSSKTGTTTRTKSTTTQIIDLVGAIDQGTSSTRFLLFTKEGKIGAYAQMEHTQYFPSSSSSDGNTSSSSNNNESSSSNQKLGWHEHDPIEIWRNVVTCITAVVSSLDTELSKTHPLLSYTIRAIGITNQRETTIAWNARTGQPYYNAIVWDDTRTTSIASHIANGNPDRLRPQTGLPLASYFAGTKVKWLLDHVNELQIDMMSHPEIVRFGTIDTWILYQLTGTPVDSGNNQKQRQGNVGGLFLTDVSNASRWLFLDLETVQWDSKLVNIVCGPHTVPMSALPEVRASSEVYATLTKESTGIDRLEGVPVSAILGDQQAALCTYRQFSIFKLLSAVEGLASF